VSDKTTWLLEEHPGRFVGIHSDRVRVDGGALIFEDGDMFNAELVLAQAPGTWQSVQPCPEDYECTHGHDEGDE
jgi:hypothetical protein